MQLEKVNKNFELRKSRNDVNLLCLELKKEKI